MRLIFINRISIVSLLFAAACAGAWGDEKDDGAKDALSLSLNALTNAAENSGVAAMSLPAQEASILAKTRTGLMAKQDGAAALHQVALGYFRNSDVAESQRIHEMAIEMAPNSLTAAQSWSRIAELTFLEQDAAAAIKPYSNAKEIIDRLVEEATASESELSIDLLRTKGTVLGWMASMSFYSGDNAAAERYEQEFVDAPGVAEAVDPSFALSANRKLATFAKERGDLEAVKKYSKAVDRIVQSSDMGIGRKISLLRESLRNRSSGPEDKEYLAAMEAMWNNPKYFPYKEILNIGDELCLAYFFSKPIRQKEFVSTAKEFRARLLLHRSEDTLMKELAADTMFVRHSLMVTEYAATYGDSGLQSKDVRREFQEASGDGEVTLGVPAWTNSSERLSRFVSIFQKRFPAAYAEFEKKVAPPKNDAVSVDPPVAKTGEKTP